MTEIDAKDQPEDHDGRVERRRFLRRGAITAAIAAAGAAAVARPAGAANGSNVQIGSGADANNTGTTTTTLGGSQFRALNGNLSISLVGEHTTTDAIGIEGRSSQGAQLRLAPNTIDLLDENDSHSFQAGSLITDTNDILWYALEDGAGVDVGLHPISLTSAFIPYAKPIRTYDSRVSGGPISPNQERVIHIFVAGAPIVAMMCNVTVVATVNSGFLAVFAADEPWNPAQPFSSINWFTNEQITANCVVSAIDVNTGNIRVRAGGAGSTHFVIDVTGVWILG